MSDNFFSSIEEILPIFVKYLQTEGQRLNTIKGNTGVVRNYLKWTSSEGLNYQTITYNDLLSYVNYQKKQGNQLRTINHKLQAIRHFYNCLQQQQLIKDNPAEELRLRGIITKQPHDLPEWEDLEELYNQYPNKNLVDKRNKVMLGMLIYQGLTSGEITALETKDVKLEEGKLYVPPTGKSNERILKLAAHRYVSSTERYRTDLLETLQDQLEEMHPLK